MFHQNRNIILEEAGVGKGSFPLQLMCTVLLWVTNLNCYTHISNFKIFSEYGKKKFQLSAYRGARHFCKHFLFSLHN